jgi:hypothetical protein
MAYMSAFFAHVAQLLARLTGGTRRSIQALQFYCSLTAGWPILEMRRRMSERQLSTTQ